MVVVWLLLSCAGPSALLCVLATLLLSLIFPAGVPNSMWLLVPETLATMVLALLLRSLGVRPGNGLQWVLLMVTLFGASVLPLFTAAALGAQALQPGW